MFVLFRNYTCFHIIYSADWLLWIAFGLDK